MVVDTTIFIEYLRARDKTRTALASLPTDSVLCMSVITVFELYAGATDASKKVDVEKLLQDVLVLPLNAAIAEKAGGIFADLRRRGLMIESTDILIAATALANNLPVKTLNVNHFNRVSGLVLV